MAELEGHEVPLERRADGYGIDFLAQLERPSPVFVRAIMPNSAAATSELHVGDRILSINGVDLTNATLGRATEALAQVAVGERSWLIVSDSPSDRALYLEAQNAPQLRGSAPRAPAAAAAAAGRRRSSVLLPDALTVDLTDPAVAKAAVTIQAGVRGYQTRRRLSEEGLLPAFATGAGAADAALDGDWMHGAISRDEAVALLGGVDGTFDDGVFLVRTKQPTGFALAVVYKGQVTHHLLSQPAGDGTPFVINQRPVPDKSLVRLPRLLAALATGKVPGWPAPLTAYVSAATGYRVPYYPNGRPRSRTNSTYSADPAAASQPQPPPQQQQQQPYQPYQQLQQPRASVRARPLEDLAEASPMPQRAAHAQLQTPQQQRQQQEQQQEQQQQSRTPSFKMATAANTALPGGVAMHIPTQWKCGECGGDNHGGAADGPRKCARCGAVRAAVRLTDSQATVLHAAATLPRTPAAARTPAGGAGGKATTGGAATLDRSTVGGAAHAGDPRVLHAKEELDRLVQPLPDKLRTRLYTALTDLAQKKIPLVDFVTKLSYMLRLVAPRRRGPIEDAISHMLPRASGAEFLILAARARKEERLEALVQLTSPREHAILARLVSRALFLLQGDPRPSTDATYFERRVHLRAAQRGWAALHMFLESGSDTLQLEHVAREVYIGWARAITLEWDSLYGPEPASLVLTKQGLLDSALFVQASAYRLYLARVRATSGRYALSAAQDADYAGVPVLPDEDKVPYRVVAEVLLHAFLAQRPQLATAISVARASEDLLADLYTLGILRDAHGRIAVVGRPTAAGAGAWQSTPLPLAGRRGELAANVPRVHIPPPPASPPPNAHVVGDMGAAAGAPAAPRFDQHHTRGWGDYDADRPGSWAHQPGGEDWSGAHIAPVPSPQQRQQRQQPQQQHQQYTGYDAGHGDDADQYHGAHDGTGAAYDDDDDGEGLGAGYPEGHRPWAEPAAQNEELLARLEAEFNDNLA